MIIDQLSLFFDGAAAAAGMTSAAVNVSSYAGRREPVYVSIAAKGGNTAPANFNVKVRQSGDNAAFTDVQSIAFTKPDRREAMYVFSLPAGVKERYVRLEVEASGDIAGVSLFAGVTRDCFAPYEPGLYLDGGKAAA